jgi:hypothetical protein
MIRMFHSKGQWPTWSRSSDKLSKCNVPYKLAASLCKMLPGAGLNASQSAQNVNYTSLIYFQNGQNVGTIVAKNDQSII